MEQRFDERRSETGTGDAVTVERILNNEFYFPMEEEAIINRVAGSALEVFDLEDYYPNGNRMQVDMAQWLFEGFLLREKDFRMVPLCPPISALINIYQ